MLELTITGKPAAGTADSLGREELAVWRDADGQVAARCFRSGGERWIELPGLGSFRFGDGARGVQALAPVGTPVERIMDAHRRVVLPLVLQALGGEVLHASAVLTERGSVALCGASGVGKSTLACALGRRGHPLQADDAVALEVGERSARLLPLPFEPRVLPDSATLIADAAPNGASPSPARPAAPAEPTAVAAIVALERVASDGDVALTQLSASDALLTVLSHAYCFSPRQRGRLRPMVEHYLALVRTVTIYRLSFRPGREHLPAVLDSIESVVS
jgi:hypothetical protein